MDTPALVVDLAVVERNIAAFQALADAAGLAARPHVKTHKIPALAQMQVAAGAVGITCQKIGEAEVMAEAGLADILLTYNILGAEKLARLRALAGRCRLSVTCDNAPVAQGLSAAFADAPAPLEVLVECDTGAGRCGVQSPAAALALAQEIDALPGLAFGGLMTYPPMAEAGAVDAWLAEARDLCLAAGLACPRISTGGTPNLGDLSAFATATEHRAGTYVYNDRSLIARGACRAEDCAAVVMATVVSRPSPARAILDAGSKALSSDLLGLEGFGLIREAPGARIASLSEEHAIVDLSGTDWQPQIGAVVSIIPNHVCVVSNLFPAVTLVHPDGRREEVPVAARGRLR
ncbi:D-TA family PLP-dependent enzyme [Poseidonocella sp. HB161398]|uniref:D-TA family PLP-dependent enzyme n=1 Tax=Poseidonocella sp. HB161398 TaxID=2320855 RepID=UPI001109C226|nr:D-TA family PLP-dependent enzyme [Poseidonocella sp. HB161398]